MSTIPLPQFKWGTFKEDFIEFRISQGQLRARDQEIVAAVLEAAAKLKPDAMEIFNSNPAMTPQETRDVIEWYSASLSALEFKHHE